MTTEFVETMLERLRLSWASNPESLLETWGCVSPGKDANVYADLIGFEDEIVAAGLGIRHRPYLLMPVRPRLSAVADSDDYAPLRVAVYKQLNSCCWLSIDAGLAASEGATELTKDDQFMCKIVLLRYRRSE